MSSSQRRQMMQQWPLCLVPFSRTKEHSVLPKYYTRVPSIARSSPTSSGTTLDCSSNSTLVTNPSPFNSQTALIVEKRNSPGNIGASHYYAQNLRNNHQKALNGSRMYDPLEKDVDSDYKQLDPLLAGQNASSLSTKTVMSTQDVKPVKDVDETERNVRSEFQKEAEPSLKRYTRQVLAAFTVSICSMVVGYSASYTSPALVSMKTSNETFEITDNTGMWIGSIMPLTALFGGIVGGPCIEKFGRRNTIAATGVPFIIAWLLIALAQNVFMVLFGRLICGFCVGIASLTLPVYLAETLQPEVRGTLGLMPTAIGNIGILSCFTVGMYLNWRNLAFLGVCIPIVFLILMFFVPETPRWYISKGKTKKAQKSLQWLRGRDADITEELAAVERLHIESQKDEVEGALMELFKKKNLKPLSISLGLMFFQQFSGINAVIFYTVQIFQDAGSSINENLATIIVGLVNFIATFVAAAVIDKLGRKILLYISGIAMIITLFVFGGFFYAKNADADVSNVGWLPLVSLIVYVIGFSLGFGPIPWLMMGEIFPVKIRGTAASVATAFNWMCTFIVTKTYGDLVKAIGASGAFWFFGIIVLVGFVFVLFCVPETRGRTLEEIEERFTGPRRRMSAIANMKPLPTST